MCSVSFCCYWVANITEIAMGCCLLIQVYSSYLFRVNINGAQKKTEKAQTYRPKLELAVQCF